MNFLFRPIRNFVNNGKNVRYFSHYHTVNIEILYQKIKDINFQQNLLVKNNNEMKTEIEILKKQLEILKNNLKKANAMVKSCKCKK